MPRKILGHGGLLSRLTGSKRWRSNSGLYQEVTNTLSGISVLMSKPVTPENVQRMATLERDLSIKSKAYLEARKNPKTSEGKARYQMIQEISQLDKIGDELRDPAKVARFQAQNRTIGDVMSEVKPIERVDISLKEKKVFGAGASKRIRFEHNGQVGYFSPEMVALSQEDTIRDLRSKLTLEERRLFTRPDVAPMIQIAEMGGVTEGKTDRELMTNLGVSDLSNFSEREINAITGYYRAIGKAETLKDAIEDTVGTKPGQEISKRNVATSRMARIMGMGPKIAPSVPMTIVDEGTTIKGTFMSAAVGCDSRSYDGLRYMSDKKFDLTSGRLQRDVNRMQVFDMLCGQVDRHGGNFFYQINPQQNARGEYEITGLQGIDNDMSFGIRSLDSKKQQLPSINELTMIDEGTFHSLTSLTEDKIKYTLGEMLEKDEVQSVIDRRNQILGAVESGQVRIVNENEWGPGTLQASRQQPYYKEIEREVSDPKKAFQEKQEEIFKEYGEKRARIEEYNRKHPDEIQDIPQKPQGYDRYIEKKATEKTKEIAEQIETRMKSYEAEVKQAMTEKKPMPKMPEGYLQYAKEQQGKSEMQGVEIRPDKPMERREVSISELEGKKPQITRISNQLGPKPVRVREMGQ